MICLSIFQNILVFIINITFIPMRILRLNFKFVAWLIACFLYFVLLQSSAFCQTDSAGNFVLINPTDTPEQIIEKAAKVTPSQRQYEWQKLELTGFIHFGINTFNEVEWGEKNTNIKIFNPIKIDVNQWVRVFKEAGIKLIILTAKHHDGFCLWPTMFTDYNISNTPFQNGKGDIVRDLSEACHKAGIKFGVYLSPWDMHEKTYGTPEYNKHFLNQLTELLTNYGEISEVWFDGANGEGSNGRKQTYDWHSYYKLIRKLQPDAVIAIMGPDVRWVGTESGYGRQTEWSVLPGATMDLSNIAVNSQQQALDNAFTPRNLVDEDLGSRGKIENAKSLIWYPAEIDVSIRPRWFYHKEDDDLVKSPYKLTDIYYNSVGLNGVLLLNIPPNKQGLITENDIRSLKGMRYLLDETFNENLARNAKLKVYDEKKGNEAQCIFDDSMETYWTTNSKSGISSIEIDLNSEQTFNRAMLQENILVGQRIEKFHLEKWDEKGWNPFVSATTIGYKRLLRFPEVKTNKIRIVIDECRTNPTISTFGLYKAPPEIKFEPDKGSFADSIIVKISSDTKNSKIYFTLDGSEPDESSQIYTNEISVNRTLTVTAIAVSNDAKRSLPVKAYFNKAKYEIDHNSKYDNKYTGCGAYTLVDGVEGSINFTDGNWQGFNGNDLDVTIDLGKVKKINKISARFLRDIKSYIFLPQSVEYTVSNNNLDFTSIQKINADLTTKEDKTIVKSFDFKPQNISARYIHIVAKNIGICPTWHIGAGDKAWLFSDEIIIE